MFLPLLPFKLLLSFMHFALCPVFLLPINAIYMFWLGIILIGIGLPIYIKSVKAIKKAYSSSELVTSGVYSYVRHPLYGSFILYIIPRNFGRKRPVLDA